MLCVPITSYRQLYLKAWLQMLIFDSFACTFLFFLFVAVDKLGTLVVRASGILIGLIRLLCDAALLAAFVYGISN